MNSGNHVEKRTIVDNNGAGVGMSLALLISIGLRRLVTLKWVILNAVCLGWRLLGALLCNIGRVATRQEGLYRGDGHCGLRRRGNQELWRSWIGSKLWVALSTSQDGREARIVKSS